jgi:hypothetical protein
MAEDGGSRVDITPEYIGPADRSAAWTWFSDDRLILDEGVDGGPRALLGSVSADSDSGGDIDLRWHDFGSGDSGLFVLHEELDQDDHNCPALYQRPDGRYLAMYSSHGGDALLRWRVSADPHDPTTWEPERTIDTGGETTYANLHAVRTVNGHRRLYCFTRAAGWDPTILVSDDWGTTWSLGGRLLSVGEDSTRPYVRYASDETRVHLVATDGHPRDSDNGLYHGYLRNETLFDSAGNPVDDPFEPQGEPAAPAELSTVFEPGIAPDGTPLSRAWGIDVAIDDEGHPVAIFQARAADDWRDHRYCYARIGSDGWTVFPLLAAGPGLYESEKDYTGLAAIDPVHPDRVVVSTPIDPRDDAPSSDHQIFAGGTSDSGATWDWTLLPSKDGAPALRPILAGTPEARVLVWMEGPYSTYRQWETRAVGFVFTGDLL